MESAGIVSGMFGLMNTGLNNAMAGRRTSQDRRENYMYNEMAAASADARTRSLYKDFYSPQALMEQYRTAGLSPSMMFGGTPGQGGTSGAQGGGSAGMQTPYMPISILEAAQAANLMAQTKKTKAETANIEQDTTLKEIQTAWDNMKKNMYAVEYNILSSTWKYEDGTETSLYEMADNSYDYDDFLKKVRAGGTEEIKEQLTSEAGQQVLRSIYTNSSKFGRDIAVLANEETDAKFKLQITKELQDANFAKLNAKEAIQTLKANIAIGELTEQQKNAWNHVLDKIGKNGSTTKDIIIILGMIIGQSLMKR